MLRKAVACLVAFVAALSATPATACLTGAPFEPSDVEYAETVVVGRIENYRIIRDPAVLEFWRSLVPKFRAVQGITPEFQKLLDEEPDGFLTDYARFDIAVDQVLAGTAPTRLTVTWNNSTFAEPDTLPNDPMMVALRDVRSPMPPLRKTTGYIPPPSEPNLPTVLQAPCSGAFLFEATSSQAVAVRAAIAARGGSER